MIVSEFTQDGLLVKELKPRSEKKILVRCEYCLKERFVSMGNLTSTRLKRKNDMTPCRKCVTGIEQASKNKGKKLGIKVKKVFKAKVIPAGKVDLIYLVMDIG